MGKIPKMFKSIDVNDEDERLVGGWANLEIVDRQGDIVPVEELEKAMMKLMDRGGYIFYGHQNKPVGKILKWEVREHPDLGVNGVYIIAKIFRDYKLDDEVWNMIKQGILRGFSIGGRSNKQDWAKAKESGEKVRVLKDIELGEISIVSEPANPYALIEEVNYFAKGEVNVYEEVDDMEAEDYRSWIEKMKEEDGKWVVYADNGEEIVKVDSREEGVRIIKELGESELGNLILMYGKGIAEELVGGNIDVEKMIRDEVDKVVIKVAPIGNVGNMNMKRVIRRWFESESEDLGKEVKKVSDRYKEGNRFKEMTCPDDPSQKSRFCGCVRAMMNDGKSLESAKKICAYIKHYVKKGSMREEGSFYRECMEEYNDKEKCKRMLVEHLRSRGRSDEEVEEAMRRIDTGQCDKGEVEVKKPDDLRPNKSWWNRCIERTGSKELCGWVFYHQLKPKKPENVSYKDKPETTAARKRKKKWIEECGGKPCSERK